MTKNLTLAALAAAIAFSLPAFAQGVLDEALNDGPAPAPAPAKVDEPKPAPAAKPDPKKAPVQDAIISPDAATAVDNKDLTEDLIGQGGEKAGPEKMFDEVLERMSTSADRLKEKDPGLETQETQRRIVMNLDTLIEIAKKQQQQKSSSSSSSSGEGQKRQQNKGQRPQPGSGQGEGGNQAASSSQLRGGSADAAQSNGQDIREKGLEWGKLPDRERDLIAKFSNEKTVPAYEEATRKFYEALAEIGRKRQND